MARRKTLPESVRAKLELAERLGALRSELFGDRGGPEMARRLSIPVRTWYNYEGGVTVPAEVMLKIIELTSVEPMWLLHGKGPKFRLSRPERAEAEGGRPSRTVGALLRTALKMLEGDEAGRPKADHPWTEESSTGREAGVFDEEEFDITLPANGSHVSPSDAAKHSPSGQGQTVTIPSSRDWIEAQREDRCLRVSGDSMAPIVADGASVAYADRDEEPAQLDGKLVVVWTEGKPIVRWYQNCGRYALLRAENSSAIPQQMLIDLSDESEKPRMRRVLWINTPH